MTKLKPVTHSNPLGKQYTLLGATVALLGKQSVETDEKHLREGLPTGEYNISANFQRRAISKTGYEAIWANCSKVEDLVFPCAILISSGEYAIALGVAGKSIHLLAIGGTDAVSSVPIALVQQHYAKCSFQVLPRSDLLLEKHSDGRFTGHWFWGRLFLYRRSLIEVVVASLFANMLAVVTSLFALQVYDRVIPGQSEATLWVLASGVGLAIFFELVLRVSRARLIDYVGKDAEIEISSDVFSRVLGMKLDKRPAAPGAIVHMAREFSAVKEFFTNVAVGVVADLPFVLIFLLLIYGIAGNVVWVIIIGAFLIVLPNIALQGRMARLSKEAMGGMSSASRLLTEVSYGLETLKTTRFEGMFQRLWEEIIALNSQKTTEQRALRASLTYWAASVQQASYVGAVIVCVYMLFLGQLSMGAIVAVGILTTRTLSPISQLSQALASWQNMKAALSALETVMCSDQERDNEKSYIKRPRLSGDLTFENVRYAHPGSKSTAVEIASLHVKAGVRLAVLGANGSGKSTFLRLAAGLLDPSAGAISFDGVDQRQIDPSDVRNNIGYLPQEIQLFRGSLKSNISGGSSKFTDQDILEALEFGGMGDFTKQHPEGLDIPISDGGGGLSIGQRQSVGLARLFLQNPSIILLDEPTSALDQNLEKAVVSRLGSWIGARTCITATHRPQILSEMTHVAVLQQGRLILHGERDAVLNKLNVSASSSSAGSTS